MIRIRQSKTADTRSCDYANVSKQTLLDSSRQHIGDVAQALGFFSAEILRAAARHDYDKLTDIDGFHADFVTGFAQTRWWDRHRQLNRHHLLQPDGVRDDVNLIDVLDMISDCVMAGMARTGTVYPLNIDPDVLMRAFQNTVTWLQRQVSVESERRCSELYGGWQCELPEGHDANHRAKGDHTIYQWHKPAALAPSRREER